jgi:predicted phage terminase large subunit-like protein
MIQSWDMAFKAADTSDYVAGQVWLRRGADVFLLDQVCRRMSFVETCQAVRAMSARWPQATAKLVEDKANGPAVISALRRQVAGFVPVEPEGSKFARASSVAPFVEAGNVHLPAVELAPWVDGLVEEAAGFPAAAHDDQVDAMSQALIRLLLAPVVDPTETYEPDDEPLVMSAF